jgi:hypothetical protein
MRSTNKSSIKYVLNRINIVLSLMSVFIGITQIFASEKMAGDTTGVHLPVAAGQFQLEPNLEANLEKINDFLDQAAKRNVELIVFPELALTGYPPKDIQLLDYINQKKTVKE